MGGAPRMLGLLLLLLGCQLWQAWDPTRLQGHQPLCLCSCTRSLRLAGLLCMRGSRGQRGRQREGIHMWHGREARRRGPASYRWLLGWTSRQRLRLRHHLQLRLAEGSLLKGPVCANGGRHCWCPLVVGPVHSQGLRLVCSRAVGQ